MRFDVEISTPPPIPGLKMRIMTMTSAWLFVLVTVAAAASDSSPFRCIMYLTGCVFALTALKARGPSTDQGALTHSQHDIVPPKDTLKEVSHVVVAFMRSEFFNVDKKPDEYPLFTSVSDVRGRFSNHTKLMVAIGGWGDTRGFEEAAKTEFSRQRWALQVAAMVASTEADGIDVDWEYPGGNRDDYREIPNSEREWEVEAFVSLLQELRAALGPERILSAAVPGKEDDLIAFTSDTIPKIMNEVDFLNVMTYDLMNRRNNLTTHHSGVQNSKDAIQRYINLGASPEQLNLGFGYYVKWFMTQQCDPEKPIGCPTQLLEDPKSGADLSKTGGFSWHDEIPEDVRVSFSHAQSYGKYDTDGSYYYWDADEHRWWTFDTKKSIQTKFDRVVPELEVGGVFAWGIGEDAPDFEHFQTTTKGVRKIRAGIGSKDEL